MPPVKATSFYDIAPSKIEYDFATNFMGALIKGRMALRGEAMKERERQLDFYTSDRHSKRIDMLYRSVADLHKKKADLLNALERGDTALAIQALGLRRDIEDTNTAQVTAEASVLNTKLKQLGLNKINRDDRAAALSQLLSSGKNASSSSPRQVRSLGEKIDEYRGVAGWARNKGNVDGLVQFLTQHHAAELNRAGVAAGSQEEAVIGYFIASEAWAAYAAAKKNGDNHAAAGYLLAYHGYLSRIPQFQKYASDTSQYKTPGHDGIRRDVFPDLSAKASDEDMRKLMVGGVSARGPNNSAVANSILSRVLDKDGDIDPTKAMDAMDQLIADQQARLDIAEGRQAYMDTRAKELMDEPFGAGGRNLALATSYTSPWRKQASLDAAAEAYRDDPGEFEEGMRARATEGGTRQALRSMTDEPGPFPDMDAFGGGSAQPGNFQDMSDGVLVDLIEDRLAELARLAELGPRAAPATINSAQSLLELAESLPGDVRGVFVNVLIPIDRALDKALESGDVTDLSIAVGALPNAVQLSSERLLEVAKDPDLSEITGSEVVNLAIDEVRDIQDPLARTEAAVTLAEWAEQLDPDLAGRWGVLVPDYMRGAIANQDGVELSQNLSRLSRAWAGAHEQALQRRDDRILLAGPIDEYSIPVRATKRQSPADLGKVEMATRQPAYVEPEPIEEEKRGWPWDAGLMDDSTDLELEASRIDKFEDDLLAEIMDVQAQADAKVEAIDARADAGAAVQAAGDGTEKREGVAVQAGSDDNLTHLMNRLNALQKKAAVISTQRQNLDALIKEKSRPSDDDLFDAL